MSQNYALLSVGTPDARVRKLSLREDDELILPEDGSQPKSFRRKIIKQRVVTETHEVKVPVLYPRVVETTYQQRIPIKKLEAVTTYEDVEEEYTAFEEVLDKEEKQIWVEETETEEYTVKVPVTRTRIVKVPFTRLEEQEDQQEVEYEQQAIEEIEGWRIDEVEDRKIVEVEEWEIFELVPTATGEIVKGESREIGIVSGSAGMRIEGTKIYKASEAQAAKDDGHDLDSIPVDYSQSDNQKSAMFIGNNGYTSGFKEGDSSMGEYDAFDSQARAMPQQDAPGQSSGAPVDDDDEEASDERFDLVRCLAYITKELNTVGDPDLEVAEFVDQLESRWRFVDADAGGLVELEELRLAVWNTEEDNAGVPMPKGKFPKALQDIVDEIWVGCGSKPAFTVWDFVRFMLNEQLLEHISIKTPPMSNGWAHADEEPSEL